MSAQRSTAFEKEICQKKEEIQKVQHVTSVFSNKLNCPEIRYIYKFCLEAVEEETLSFITDRNTLQFALFEVVVGSLTVRRGRY